MRWWEIVLIPTWLAGSGIALIKLGEGQGWLTVWLLGIGWLVATAGIAVIVTKLKLQLEPGFHRELLPAIVFVACTTLGFILVAMDIVTGWAIFPMLLVSAVASAVTHVLLEEK